MSKKGYKPPRWFNAIKTGSHGATPTQKRYWKVISDTYREHDFNTFHGKCVSCPRILERWEDGQLAHYKAWSNCNSWFKYERKNLALSCARCNHINDGFVAEMFKKELQRRWGEDVIEWIDTENRKFTGQKMEEWEIVQRVEELRPDLVYEE